MCVQPTCTAEMGGVSNMLCLNGGVLCSEEMGGWLICIAEKGEGYKYTLLKLGVNLICPTKMSASNVQLKWGCI